MAFVTSTNADSDDDDDEQRALELSVWHCLQTHIFRRLDARIFDILNWRFFKQLDANVKSIVISHCQAENQLVENYVRLKRDFKASRQPI